MYWYVVIKPLDQGYIIYVLRCSDNTFDQGQHEFYHCPLHIEFLFKTCAKQKHNSKTKQNPKTCPRQEKKYQNEKKSGEFLPVWLIQG